VTADESAMLCSGFAGCGFVETSAKKNWNIDELFRQLFQLADLPPEMAPNSHRRLLPAQVLPTQFRSQEIQVEMSVACLVLSN
jgi:hypothetical protein